MVVRATEKKSRSRAEGRDYKPVVMDAGNVIARCLIKPQFPDGFTFKYPRYGVPALLPRSYGNSIARYISAYAPRGFDYAGDDDIGISAYVGRRTRVKAFSTLNPRTAQCNITAQRRAATARIYSQGSRDL